MMITVSGDGRAILKKYEDKAQADAYTEDDFPDWHSEGVQQIFEVFQELSSTGVSEVHSSNMKYRNRIAELAFNLSDHLEIDIQVKEQGE